MARAKVSKTNRPAAERAGEHYLHEICGCIPEQIIRAVRTQWQRVDLWACDVAGRDEDGFCYYAQVTAGQNEAVRTRRRKIEAINWNPMEAVFVLQLVEQPNPANARRKDFYFRVHEYFVKGKTWIVRNEACPVPRSWFKKLQREGNK